MIAEYTSHSFLMVEVVLNYKHSIQNDVQASLTAMRIIEQLLASLLFMIYTYRLLWSRKDATEVVSTLR